MRTASQSSRISVTVSDDGLTAFVSVRAGGAETEAELGEVLARASVRAGLDANAFQRLALGLSDPEFAIEREVIARGRPPEEGEDGRFESPFVEGIRPGCLREDGTMDFLDRELLKPVNANDCIGWIRPARAGNAGYLVDGTPVEPRAVREVTTAIGPGADRDAEGAIRATRSGAVICKSSQSIEVIDQLVHQGSVDLRSGHLYMQGSLLVKGDVQRSFSVYATSELEIRGTVDNGNLYAGGNARVTGEVRGGAGTTVCAEGDLSVHYAESATLFAGRRLQVAEAVHSRLAAARIEVSGKLRGGAASAEFSVIAREVGSAHGTETELAAAEPLELPVAAAQHALERAKALRAAKPGAGGPRGERSKGGKLGRVKAELDRANTERLAARVRRRETLEAVGFIEVHLVHAGVTLRVGREELLIESEAKNLHCSIDPQTGKLQTRRIGG